MYILDAVEKTSIHTLDQIRKIKELMQEYKSGIRDQFKFYSQDLLNNLFRHPYTKIESVMKEVDVSRPTATSYLKQLVEHGFLDKHKVGKSNFYVNRRLFDLFSTHVRLTLVPVFRRSMWRYAGREWPPRHRPARRPCRPG